MNIEDWRSEIDAVDAHLLKLLNRRAKLAVEVGWLKRSTGAPICDPQREHEVLTRLARNNEGPLDNKAVARIFRRIIHESRRVELRTTEAGEPDSREVQQ